MEPIDELVPLDPEDIQFLETQRYTSNLGCAIFLFVILAVAGSVAFVYSTSYWVSIPMVIVALLCLVAGLWIVFAGKTEEKDVTLDIQEGKKRRIVAPIESKEIMDDLTGTHNRLQYRSSVAAQAARSVAELKFKYSMTVREWKFDLTEEEYLGGAKKGDMVEFYVAPKSGKILSRPVAVSE